MTQEQAQSPSSTVLDTDSMAQLVIQWQQHIQATLKHFMTVPEDTEVELDDNKFTLSGDALQAFKLGLLVAMKEFESLPFFASEQVDTQEPAEQLQ